MNIPEKLVIQLFNGATSKVRRSKDLSSPNHLRDEGALRHLGFELRAVSHSWLYDTFLAQMHNAFRGLDPLRAFYVLIFCRKAWCVCAHMESALLILLLRKLVLFRPPVIIWEVPWSPGWKFRKIVSRLTIPRADRCVVFSTNQIALIENEFKVKQRPFFIPFCVDTKFFQLENLSSTGDYVFSTGKDTGRDFDLLISVASEMCVPFKLRTSLVPAQKRDNIQVITEAVSFEDYRNLYCHAAFVVVTAYSTPNAAGVTSLLEAMAMGKAVIVSDTPALRDYLPPPDAGIVIPIGNATALKTAIYALWANPEKAIKMGANARQFLVENFSMEKHFLAYGLLLENIVA